MQALWAEGSTNAQGKLLDCLLCAQLGTGQILLSPGAALPSSIGCVVGLCLQLASGSQGPQQTPTALA